MRRLRDILPILGIVVGLLIVAYYPAVELWDAYQRSQIATSIDVAAAEADDQTLAEIFAQAEAYNLNLIGLTADIAADEIWDYEDQLNLTGHDTAFGYVIIPSLSLTMPIYHGTSDAVLSVGAGHLETSSLPVGGTGTHAVITAHSGLSGMRAFDDIDQLEVGDVFGIKVLGQLICYEVTSIEVVLPTETSSLAIQADEDLCTLITCTPYGVNSHRLLVHGTRCEVPEGFEGTASSAVASVVASQRMTPFLVALAVVALALVAVIVLTLRRGKKRAPAAAAAGAQSGGPPGVASAGAAAEAPGPAPESPPPAEPAPDESAPDDPAPAEPAHAPRHLAPPGTHATQSSDPAPSQTDTPTTGGDAQ